MIRALKTTADPPAAFAAGRRRRRCVEAGRLGLRAPRVWLAPPTHGWTARRPARWSTRRDKVPRRRREAVPVDTERVLRLAAGPDAEGRRRRGIERTRDLARRLAGLFRRAPVRRSRRTHRAVAIDGGWREPPPLRAAPPRCLSPPDPRGRRRDDRSAGAPTTRYRGARRVRSTIACDDRSARPATGRTRQGAASRPRAGQAFGEDNLICSAAHAAIGCPGAAHHFAQLSPGARQYLP